jgi:hypothetical protein
VLFLPVGELIDGGIPDKTSTPGLDEAMALLGGLTSVGDLLRGAMQAEV